MSSTAALDPEGNIVLCFEAVDGKMFKFALPRLQAQQLCALLQSLLRAVSSVYSGRCGHCGGTLVEAFREENEHVLMCARCAAYAWERPR